MQVIFLENIEDNKVGDIKEVANGYARNFLFKRGIAKLATDAEISNLEKQMTKLKKEEEDKVKKAEETAKKIGKEKIVIKEEVNEEGHLFGSVGNREIAGALEDKGYEIEPGDIEIDEPIKELGEYEVVVKTGHGVETKVKVKIERAKE